MSESTPIANAQSPADYIKLIDASITSESQDLLNFRPTAQAVAETIIKIVDSKGQETSQSKDSRRTQGDGLTIGVYGEWGSGKTSFLKLVEKYLNKQSLTPKDRDRLADKNISEKDKQKIIETGICPIWFEAWKYDRQEDLWAALVQTILNKMSDRGKWYQRVRVKFRIWRASISVRSGMWEIFKKLLPIGIRIILIAGSLYLLFSLGLGIAGPSLGSLLQKNPVLPAISGDIGQILSIILAALLAAVALDPFKLFDLFKGKTGIDFTKFQRKRSFVERITFVDTFTDEFLEIIHLLEPGKKPLIVIIDDLDRCLPENVVPVLEAIKVFLNFEKCVFLLALDRKMVERYVAFKYKDMMSLDEKEYRLLRKGTEFYENYLDKIVQMTFVVPRLDTTAMSTFITKLSSDKDIAQCASIFCVGLSPNPRRIKRTIIAFLLARDLMEKKDKTDVAKKQDEKYSSVLILAKLIVIQYQYPYIYEELIEKQEHWGYLEQYYRDEGGPSALASIGKKDQRLEEVIKDAAKYPKLRDIFREKINDRAAFSDIPLDQLNRLLGTVDEVRPPVDPGVDISARPVVQRNWKIPYSRNPFFIGRSELLKTLHENFTKANKQRQVISGLGGIGKTQIALEYAYLYRYEYESVLWANAADRDALRSDFVIMADWLHLPGRDTQNQDLIVDAVKRWLSNNTNWLLILDNADDLTMVNDFLPLSDAGYILLTTRTQAVGEANSIEVKKLDKDEGVLLLLRRAKVLAADALLSEAQEEERTQAEKIVEAMDGLPLALDQAGAYIEGRCSLSEYLNHYQNRGIDLLRRRGSLLTSHPEPVATTWSVSFHEVEQANPAAAHLLRLCAFLDPDTIPEELITSGAPDLGPILGPVAADHLRLDDAIEELQRYSLLQFNRVTKSLSIHRLVQVILKEDMKVILKEDRKVGMRARWAERAVRVVDRAFPEDVKVTTWERCQLYLPQALAGADLIEEYKFTFLEAAGLLYRTGGYLFDRSQLAGAESLYQRALAIREKQLGPEHPDVAQSLNSLALLYHFQDKYKEAEPLYQRALAIRKKRLGLKHPDVATSYDGLAGLYQEQGEYKNAELLYKKALAIREKVLGLEHPDVATSYDHLAGLYQEQGNYSDAEPLYQRALTIREKQLDPEHRDVANTYNNLAILYEAQGKYPQAEQLYKLALEIWEDQLGRKHRTVAICLNNLAQFYQKKNDYSRAEDYYKQALEVYKEISGSEDPDVAKVRKSYAEMLLLRKVNRNDEATRAFWSTRNQKDNG